MRAPRWFVRLSWEHHRLYALRERWYRWRYKRSFKKHDY